MQGYSTLLDEDFPARIEALFGDRAAAAAAASALCQRFGLDASQLSIISPDASGNAAHRNRFAFRASGRRLQRRQLGVTLAAFTLMLAGFGALEMASNTGLLPGTAVAVVLGLMVIGAVLLMAVGLLSWRPARQTTRIHRHDRQAVLLVQVHDVSEQYALRRALLELGARDEVMESAGVS